jgi:membrane associated rhomboid family serine protease
MFAPINTDAPIYYWPKATLGLIVFMTAVLIGVDSSRFGPPDEVFEKYALVYGDGLHPLQWVTSNFLHDGWVHLIGNAIFLWGFGIVIEGKIGSLRFLAVFLTIGVVECAIEQACLQSSTGSSVGASSVIFGLLAMALFWAPQNELTIGYIFAMRAGSFDISIQAFAILMFVQEILIAAFYGFAFGSFVLTETLHLAGAVVGAGLGYAFLKLDWVDCEGWDLLSLRKKNKRKPLSSSNVDAAKKKKKKKKSAKSSGDVPAVSEEELAIGAQKAKCLAKMRAAIINGRPVEAWNTLQKTQHLLPDWNVPDQDVLGLSDALHEAQEWEPAAKLLVTYLKRHPEAAANLRLQLAEIFIAHLRRPQAALKVMHPINAEHLRKDERVRFVRLKKQALRMVDNGVMEFDAG